MFSSSSLGEVKKKRETKDQIKGFDLVNTFDRSILVRVGYHRVDCREAMILYRAVWLLRHGSVVKNK